MNAPGHSLDPSPVRSNWEPLYGSQCSQLQVIVLNDSSSCFPSFSQALLQISQPLANTETHFQVSELCLLLVLACLLVPGELSTQFVKLTL